MGDVEGCCKGVGREGGKRWREGVGGEGRL